jgi:AcrR family transcriptional regulator
MSPRRSIAEARRTRETIERHATDLATTIGLEGLSIGRLALDLGMSKAGVIGHFGTKEALQLAVIETAVETFVERVWAPAAAAAPGRSRLEALCDAWLDYLASDELQGGCFLTAAACEFDGRPGPVREAIATAVRAWLQVLAAEAATAIANGEIAGASPEQVAFELNALTQAANQAQQLLDDPTAFDRARRAMHRLLGEQLAASPRGAAPPRRRD